MNPDAEELCNTIDDDCDGEIDEASDITMYPDEDGDGYGDPSTSLVGCDAPEDWVENGEDCDDTDADVNLTVLEICDGIDNNCDGFVDSEMMAVGEGSGTTYYIDEDGDGYGVSDSVKVACEVPSTATRRPTTTATTRMTPSTQGPPSTATRSTTTATTRSMKTPSVPSPGTSTRTSTDSETPMCPTSVG